MSEFEDRWGNLSNDELDEISEAAYETCAMELTAE